MLAVSMSLPILHYPAMQKRPKLSLKTSELPVTYGASSRSLSTIATPTATVTPTTRNTFNNTFDLTHRPSPTSATAPPSVLRPTSERDLLSRTQSPRPQKGEVAYAVNLPYGIKPILKNTPYPRNRNNSISASPRSSTRRVFFPAPKQVVFKNTLEEEIVTKLYLARHSDLLEDGAEAASKLEVEASGSGSDSTSDSESQRTSTHLEGSRRSSSTTTSSPKRRKCHLTSTTVVTTRDDTSSPSSSSTIATAADSPPVATPSSTRKRRKWEWTLAPVPDSRSAVEPKPEQDTDLNSTSTITDKSQGETERTSQSAIPTLKASRTARQDSAVSVSESCLTEVTSTAPPQQPQSQPSSPETTIFPSLTPQYESSRPTTTPSPPTSQKRAGSLDSSPRKRKAECLDMTLGSLSDLVTTHDNTDQSVNSGMVESSRPSRTGLKRRERAATL